VCHRFFPENCKKTDARLAKGSGLAPWNSGVLHEISISCELFKGDSVWCGSSAAQGWCVIDFSPENCKKTDARLAEGGVLAPWNSGVLHEISISCELFKGD